MLTVKILTVLVASDGSSKCLTPDLMSFAELEGDAGIRLFACTEKSCKRRIACTVTILASTPSICESLNSQISRLITMSLCT